MVESNFIDRLRRTGLTAGFAFLVSTGAGWETGTSFASEMSETEVIGLVTALPRSPEKRVALEVIRHPDTEQYIDKHGYPAWRWRGPDDIGSCVHIDPKSGQPYLENQYGRSERTVPKYIDFGTDGSDWQCRIHFKRPIDWQRNWSNAVCDRRGRQLVRQLIKELQ